MLWCWPVSQPQACKCPAAAPSRVNSLCRACTMRENLVHDKCRKVSPSGLCWHQCAPGWLGPAWTALGPHAARCLPGPRRLCTEPPRSSAQHPHKVSLTHTVAASNSEQARHQKVHRHTNHCQTHHEVNPVLLHILMCRRRDARVVWVCLLALGHPRVAQVLG